MTVDQGQRRPVAAPGNYFDGCLLLLLAESPDHGYGLVSKLDQLGLAHVDTGKVYRVLRRLNAEGLVESWWEPGTGPARRRYRVTPAGAAYLDQCASSVAASTRSLGDFLDRQRRVAARRRPIAALG